jgi:hypothetical protein
MQSLHELRIGMEGILANANVAPYVYILFSFFFSFSRPCLTPCFFLPCFCFLFVIIEGGECRGSEVMISGLICAFPGAASWLISATFDPIEQRSCIILSYGLVMLM